MVDQVSHSYQHIHPEHFDLVTLCRLRALVAKREWNEIEEIAKAKKSPIGWEVSHIDPELGGSARWLTIMIAIL